MDGSRVVVDLADEHLGFKLIICGNEQHLIEGEVDGLGFKFLNYWGISPISFSLIKNHQSMIVRVFIADDLNYHQGSFTRLFDTHHSILSANRHLSKSVTFGNLNKWTNPSLRVHHRCLA